MCLTATTNTQTTTTTTNTTEDLSSSTLPSSNKQPANPTQTLQPSCGFVGCPASHASHASHATLPLPQPAAPAPTGPRLPQLIPVPLGRSEGGLGFSVGGGGPAGQQAVVRSLWDPRLCPALQTGDVITKINGADVLHLNFTQVP